MKRLVLILSMLLAGCATGPLTQEHPREGYPSPSIGMRQNPFGDDPNLAAVSVIEGPANPADRYGFTHRQPTQICYAFWDGRVRQVEYRGDGSVWDAFWWPYYARLTQGSVEWSGFDFNYGSDPTFLRHKDPRLPAR